MAFTETGRDSNSRPSDLAELLVLSKPSLTHGTIFKKTAEAAPPCLPLNAIKIQIGSPEHKDDRKTLINE